MEVYLPGSPSARCGYMPFLISDSAYTFTGATREYAGGNESRFVLSALLQRTRARAANEPDLRFNPAPLITNYVLYDLRALFGWPRVGTAHFFSSVYARNFSCSGCAALTAPENMTVN